MKKRRSWEVADLVDALHDGVEGCVVADGGVCAEEVVVDGAGEADDGEVELVGEDAGAGERAVAADYHERVDAVAAQCVIGELSSFGGLELLATGGLEYGAAALYDVGDVGCGELDDFVGHQPAVSAVYAFDFESGEYGRACDGADRRVHAGGVTSGGQYSYAFYFCHGLVLFLDDVVSDIVISRQSY